MKKYVMVLATFLACSSAFAQIPPDFDNQLTKAATEATNQATNQATPSATSNNNPYPIDMGVRLPNSKEFDSAVKNKLQTSHPHAESIVNLGLIGHDQPGNGQDEKYWYYYMMYESKSTIFQVVQLTYTQYAYEQKGWEILPEETVVVNKRLSADKMQKKVENLRRDLLKCDTNRSGVRECTKGSLYDYLHLLAKRAALPYVDEIKAVNRERFDSMSPDVSRKEVYSLKINHAEAEFSLSFYKDGCVEATLNYLN